LERWIFTSSHCSSENKLKEGSSYGWLLEFMFFLGTCVEKKTKEEEEWEKGKKYVGRKLVVKVLG
jgi:hypothetical protein